VALDLQTGVMRVSVDGGEWLVASPEGCTPSAITGAALFPALSGEGGARLQCNWGADARRPMKHAPPSGDYMAVGRTREVLPIPLGTPLLPPPIPDPTLHPS
jgi:hypothetical protein